LRRKGSLFVPECSVQEIFHEIADFGVRCAQVGVVTQTHPVAHLAALCPLVHQFLEALVQSDRRILATGQILQLPVVRRRMDSDPDRFRNIHVVLHVRPASARAEAGHRLLTWRRAFSQSIADAWAGTGKRGCRS
jgi:hypothetical protein